MFILPFFIIDCIPHTHTHTHTNGKQTVEHRYKTVQNSFVINMKTVIMPTLKSEIFMAYV